MSPSKKLLGFFLALAMPAAAQTQIPPPPISVITSLIPPVHAVETLADPISVTGATISGITDSAITADQILAWDFCTGPCLPMPSFGGGNYDAVRGVGHLTAGSTIPLVNGVSGYVLVDQPVTIPTSVALFGVGVVNVDGGAVWGINTTLSDNEYRVPSTHGDRHLYNEIDLSFSNPNSSGVALIISGNSVVQPKSAIGIALEYLDFTKMGSVAKWEPFLYSADGAAWTFANIGPVITNAEGLAGGSGNSQKMIWGTWISGHAFGGHLDYGLASAPNFGSNSQPSFNFDSSIQISAGGLTARPGSSDVFQVGAHINLGSGPSLIARTDAFVDAPMEIKAANLLFTTTGGRFAIDSAGRIDLTRIVNGGAATKYVCVDGSNQIVVQVAACGGAK
jgi:hypothetical protein